MHGETMKFIAFVISEQNTAYPNGIIAKSKKY